MYIILIIYLFFCNFLDVKQINGMEYMNGNGVNLSDKMDDFEVQFQSVFVSKIVLVLDFNVSFFEFFG